MQGGRQQGHMGVTLSLRRYLLSHQDWERKVPAFSLRDSLPVEWARTSDQYLATTGPGLHRRFSPTLKTLSYALMLTGIGKAPAVVTSVVDWVPKYTTQIRRLEPSVTATYPPAQRALTWIPCRASKMRTVLKVALADESPPNYDRRFCGGERL